MGSLRSIFWLVFLFLTTGCQIGYLAKSSYDQLALLNSRIDISKADLDSDLTEDQKRKIRLAQKVREFTSTRLHLKKNNNYTSYVKLNRPSVKYVVNAAQKWKLEKYEWWFPIVGRVPYKGFSLESDAKDEQQSLIQQDLDTGIRGVSAYSTLGWFDDPILTSMLKGKDHDLVNTIIHESVHATLYLKNSADFNERMAVFLGYKGTELFYLAMEGQSSKTYQVIQQENLDEQMFSEFIGRELEQLQAWYDTQPPKNEDLRKQKLKQIQERFTTTVKPRLKSKSFERFDLKELNNAELLIYKTYIQDLNDFALLFQKSNSDFNVFLDHCRSFENSEEPEKALKELVSKLSTI